MLGNRIRTTRKLLLGAALLAVVACNGWAKVVYVDDDANGPGNGTSWQNAYKYLQDALVDAKAAEKPVEIRVAQGVYKPDRTSAKPTGSRDREATFRLIDQVTLRGGFAGVSAADPNARDVTLYKSILSGDLAGDDVELTNPLAAREEPTRIDNCYHVVGANSPPTPALVPFTAELDGFVITKGQAFTHKLDSRVQVPPSHKGGGMHVAGLGTSGVSRLTIRDCLFIHNYADNSGGAIYSRFMGDLALVNCTFIENGAYDSGGGLHDFRSIVALTDCRFARNQADDMGAAIFASSCELMTLAGCTLIGNVASGSGGGIAAESSPMKCVDCVLQDNIAATWGGGGIYPSGAVDFLGQDCRFVANRAGHTGGAIMKNGDGSLSLKNCLLCGNDAKAGGGALRSVCSDTLQITNCTGVGNRGGKGRFLLEESQGVCYSNSQITGCIVSDGGNEVWNSYGVVSIRYSDIAGGVAAVHDPKAFAIWGPGNIHADPLFADPGHWDPNGTPDDPNDDFWVGGDYHLKSRCGRWEPISGSWVRDDVTSLCIDAGDPNSAIGEEPFPNGGRINLGVYGGTAEASKSYFGGPLCETQIPGDINGDCREDAEDLAMLARNWLRDERPRPTPLPPGTPSQPLRR